MSPADVIRCYRLTIRVARCFAVCSSPRFRILPYPFFSDYGQGAIKAHNVYGGSEYLSVAESVWRYVNSFAITLEQIKDGVPERNLTSFSSCGSKSFRVSNLVVRFNPLNVEDLVGGVFWVC